MSVSHADQVGRTRIQPRPAHLPQKKPHAEPSTALFLYFAIQAPDQKWVGSRYFALTQLQGSEGVSVPFEYQLELRANSAPADPPGDASDPWPTGSATDTDGSDWEVSFEMLLGRPAALGIARPTPDWPTAPTAPTFDGYHAEFLAALAAGAALPPSVSVLHGVISSFSFAAPGCYSATLRPYLWQLTLTNHYRVLHGSVVEVIAQVLMEHGFTEQADLAAPPQGPQFSTRGVGWLGRNRRQDWFQAGESDYALLQRLMGKANLYYYFEQGACGHTVVFSNAAPTRALNGSVGPAALADRANTLRYAFTGSEELGLDQEDLITDYRYEQSLRTTAIRASFVRQPAVWESNDVVPFAAYAAQAPRAEAGGPGPRPFHLNRVYPYGGLPADQQEEADCHAEQLEAMLQGSAHKLSGSSKSPAFHVGRWFLLTEGERRGKDAQGHPSVASPELIRPSLQGRRFVLTSVKHQASIDGRYQNSFEARELGDLLTEFDAQEPPGSVLAEVVAHADNGAEWQTPRFLPPSAFDFSRQAPDFEGPPPDRSELREPLAPGVLVRLCTDPHDANPVWVKLADGMPSAPQIGSIVLVARARDYSEMPEIQQVIDSHGSMVVMPPADKGLRWQTNTSVGSNQSTAYGDSQSIRYGGLSPGVPQLNAAEAFVRGAYLHPDQMFASGGTSLVAQEALTAASSATSASSSAAAQPTRNASAPAAFTPAAAASSGASAPPSGFSAPAVPAPRGPGGFKDVSYSQGGSCSYSESDAGPDGVLGFSLARGSSWNSSISAWTRSYAITGSERERQQHDASSANAFDGLAQASQSWVYGDSASQSLVSGRQLSSSAVGNGARLPPLPAGCTMGTHSVLIGDSKNISEVTGNSESSSLSTGNSTNFSMQTGSRSSTSVLNGASSDRSTITGPATSVSTFSTQDNTVTAGAQSNTSTIGATTSNSLTGTSLSNGIVGVSTSNALSGVETSTRLVGASNSTGLTGAALSTGLTGASSSVSLTGAAESVSLTGTTENVNLTGTSSSVQLTGGSTNVALTGAASSVNLTGTSSTVNLTGSSNSVSLTGASTSVELCGSSSSVRLTGSSSSIQLSGPSSSINLAGPTSSINLTGPQTSADISPGRIVLSAGGSKIEIITMQITL